MTTSSRRSSLRVLAWVALTAGWCVAAASLGPVASESLLDVLQVEFALWGR